MKKTSVHCPACGSDKVTRSEKTGFGQVTLGESFSYTEIGYVCSCCHEEGDFLFESDENYLSALKDAQSTFVKKMLEDMSKVGISMAMIERVFELPQRTLTRWKTGDFSATSLALLRIIAVYPWVIEVAEHKFDHGYADCAIIHAAAEKFQSVWNQPAMKYGNHLVSNGNSPLFFSNDNLHIEA